MSSNAQEEAQAKQAAFKRKERERAAEIEKKRKALEFRRSSEIQAQVEQPGRVQTILSNRRRPSLIGQ